MLVEQMDYMYLRLSKEDGDVDSGSVEESCSISSQRICIQRFLQSNGFSEESFEEIVDDGYSGTNMNRPGMERLLQAVERGQARIIVVRDLSRFSRNYLEAGKYLELIFPLHGIRFISINDHFDSRSFGEDACGLEIAIKNLTNSLYSKDISRKVKSAMDIKKLNGEYVYGTAPYGYKKGERKNTIEVDPVAAEIVKQIFMWAESGITVTQIARNLNEAHVDTPSVYLASTRGQYKTWKTWTYESVRNILWNRIYTGDTVPFKSHVIRVGSDLVRQVPVAKQQIIPNTHEAIITHEQYEEAHMIIKSNQKSKPATKQNPFTSLLVCGCCGKRLVKGKAQNKHWLCTNRRYDSRLPCKDIRADELRLSDVVIRSIVTQCKLLDAKLQKQNQRTPVIRSQAQCMQEELDKLQKKLERFQMLRMQYYENYVSGSLSKEAFLQKKTEVVEQERAAKAQEELLSKRLEEKRKEEKVLARQMTENKQLVQYQEVTELTAELTKKLIKEIVVFPDQRIRIVWNFSDGMAEMAETIDFSEMEQAI